MPRMNRMTRLLDKIERRLGTKALNLPEDYAKDKWAEEVICNETLDTFSRYFPHRISYMLNSSNRIEPDVWLIDENLCENQVIIGGGDIDWHKFSMCPSGAGLYGGICSPMDSYAFNYDYEDTVMQQVLMDQTSLFKTGIYLDYEEPNKLTLNTTFSGNNLGIMEQIPIFLYIKHAPNLMTIADSKMETFENLAQADVAAFLYEGLKYYDNLETVFASTELKLSDLQDKANKRDDVVQELKESYVSAANKVMPLAMAI